MNQPNRDEYVGETAMSQGQLIDYGCDYCTAEDQFGDTRSGYWFPGDGDGQGYGDFLGETPEAATMAISG
jgi:hypothetical protein